MGARSSGREAALQMLFALDTSGDSADLVISRYWRAMPFSDRHEDHFEFDPEARRYADSCVAGVASRMRQIDEKIQAASTNWRLERMTRVDRNLLRLGTYELIDRADVPLAVVLDEAVELAKRFGSGDSSAFVNGVLDRVAQVVGRSASR